MGGVVLFTILTFTAGLAVSIFDNGQIGFCADAIVTALFIGISGFIAALGAHDDESATGAVVGLGAVVPQSILTVVANRFSVPSLLVSVVAFTLIGAVGGAVAYRARQLPSES